MSYLDVTILHAWRAEPAFEDVEGFLRSRPDVSIRNFGIPWHDPVYRSGTEEGMAYLTNLAEVQVLPAKVLVIVPSLFEDKAAVKWAEIQLNAGRGKPLLVVAPDDARLPDWMEPLSFERVRPVADEVIAAILYLAR